MDCNEHNQDIKISLAAARINAKMTQDEVARIVRKSKQTIGNWESGKSQIDTANLCLLSDLYKIPVKNIFLPQDQT